MNKTLKTAKPGRAAPKRPGPPVRERKSPRSPSVRGAPRTRKSRHGQVTTDVSVGGLTDNHADDTEVVALYPESVPEGSSGEDLGTGGWEAQDVVASVETPDATTALSLYFREMALHRLLKPEEEQIAVREIEEKEIVLWEKIFSFVPALEVVIHISETALKDAEGELEVPHASFRAVRQAASETSESGTVAARRRYAKSVRKLAEKLRATDVDKEAVQMVIAALRAASLSLSAASKSNHKAYLAQVSKADRQAGAAREAFIKANLRLVVAMARRYRRDLLSLADLIQEGNIGLMKGVARYDYRRGVKFSTYASWWIRHAINRALADKGREVRVPVHLLEAQKQVAKAQRELDSKLGRWATTEEIAEAAKVPLEKIEKLRTYLRDHAVSLDQPLALDGDNEHGLIEIFSDPHGEGESALDSLASGEMSEKVDEVIRDVLKPMEADILRRRFGFDADREYTLKEIGQQYNLSRERVRQLQMQSLSKVRDALRRRQMM